MVGAAAFDVPCASGKTEAYVPAAEEVWTTTAAVVPTLLPAASVTGISLVCRSL